jgi:8-oxo-dGTP pyrophosphatase MutT (NUDIX family)
VVPVREAATVVLVRDRPHLEVLLLRRSASVVFSPGASVFPGGGVAPEDADPAVTARVRGGDDASRSAEMSLPGGGLAVTVAAVRECFEEAGLLLARDRTSGQRLDTLLDPVRRGDLAARRDELNAGRCSWLDVLEAQDCTIDVRDLSLFAHWRTPLGAPRRYDTWFFVAEAPDGDDGVHDDGELVASTWARPCDLLEQERRGEIELILPTLRALTVLDRFTHAHDVVRAVRGVAHDASGRPEVVPDAGGERLRLAGDARGGFGWTVPLPDLDFRAAREGVA